MKRRMAMVTALAALLMLGSLVSPVSALEEADRLFMVGEQALADRFFSVAKRTLDRFVSQYPKDPRTPRATLLLGQARLALNEPQPALEAFQKAQTFLSTPAEQLEVKFWEAEALFRLKRYAEARAAYDAVVRADAASPLAPEALYGYGFSELELKRPEPAITAFRDFISTWPEHALAPAVTLQLARAYVELKRVNDALPLLAGFASKYPNSKMAPDAQFLLGYMKVTTGDPRGGIADLRAFLASNPNHEQAPTARRLVGQALGKYGDREDLAEAYKSLMEQDPPTAEALSDAAAIAGRLNRTKDQEEAWKKLRARVPGPRADPTDVARSRRRPRSSRRTGRTPPRSPSPRPRATTTVSGPRRGCSSARRSSSSGASPRRSRRSRPSVGSATSTRACASARWPVSVWRARSRRNGRRR